MRHRQDRYFIVRITLFLGHASGSFDRGMRFLTGSSGIRIDLCLGAYWVGISIILGYNFNPVPFACAAEMYQASNLKPPCTAGEEGQAANGDIVIGPATEWPGPGSVQRTTAFKRNPVSTLFLSRKSIFVYIQRNGQELLHSTLHFNDRLRLDDWIADLCYRRLTSKPTRRANFSDILIR
ncbi:uncharacterized protein BT62DRAFT_1012769 [Guyanagaster necrorhizus]|uniref:Uncharacterized protein n=1 Tax=Guyanagaster necrorhizus TaxID=856835 RepID=A0A9P8ALN4_9AGAR|nr:uncharacterized protein BT62DRAFT_1012769 [Guyanagaster necrorhizus MCA 3950]KAG7440403.1 hypothetical protein BT62DRAFT_1012769 [Guyanagaster necrorhizus MCA 3950]